MIHNCTRRFKTISDLPPPSTLNPFSYSPSSCPLFFHSHPSPITHQPSQKENLSLHTRTLQLHSCSFIEMSDAPPQLGEIPQQSELHVPTIKSQTDADSSVNGNRSFNSTSSYQNAKESLYNSEVCSDSWHNQVTLILGFANVESV